MSSRGNAAAPGTERLPGGLTRRAALRGIAGASLAGPFAAGCAASFGTAPTDRRLVVVVLRGGLDGLHAVPPYADPRYRGLRPTLALPPPGAPGGALDLDGRFGLHPALAPLHRLYARNQLLVVQAATTSYRDRSHFDAQNQLENGSGKPYGAADGWLNRALVRLNGGDRRLGLSLGHAVPLVMRGPAEVIAWAPSNLPKAGEDLLDRLAALYEADPMLAGALRQARLSQALTEGVMDGMAYPAGPRARLEVMARAAGRLLARAGGPRVAVLESTGWDTHVDQAGRLAGLLDDLANGLGALEQGLGPAWAGTVVVVVSEFGRTAAENGSRGTDHGVGGIALLLGGAVAGGRIAGDWPGLAPDALHEGRDLRPTTEYRSIFKAVLGDHLGLGEAAIEDEVFPGSRAARPMPGLVRPALS